ncbi:MAG: glycosyltransferase family 4 protein [Sedimenticola sp.]
MNILIVSQYFWPENFRINDLALALKERGHDVTILTGMPNYPAGKIYNGYSWWKNKRDNMQGIPVIRVPLFARRKSRSWQLALNYLSFVVTSCLFGAWLLRNQSFDIVFTYQLSPATVGIPGILMKKLKRAPMLFWVQDLWPESLSATGSIKSPAILSAVSRMVKNIYRNCDRILIQSRGFVAPAVAVGAERDKIEYFPNWAEPLYQPVVLDAVAPERSEVPTEGFVVMFAGNLGTAQSLDTIIEAATLCKDEPIHWVFLGDGRRREWLERAVEDNSLSKVHVLGSRPIESMPAYFSLADVMLVTLRDAPVMTTTIPGKIQSYLACAKPIVAALNGEGARVIEESGAGISVASADSEGLAAAVVKMSHLSEREFQEMGSSALLYYKSYFEREMLVSQLDLWMQQELDRRSTL